MTILTQESTMFQKNLVVWKPYFFPLVRAEVILNQVSEELSSVETTRDGSLLGGEVESFRRT